MESFTPSQRDVLAKAQQALSVPVRRCNLRHEDLRRDRTGAPLPVLSFAPECRSADQHCGCPHYLYNGKRWSRRRDFVLRALKMLWKKGDQECMRIREEINRCMNRLSILDGDARIARTRVETDAQLLCYKKCDMPNREKALQNVAPVLATFNATLDEIETLRTLALAKVTAALV